MTTSTPALPIRLGCPVFGCNAWSGIVYPERTSQRNYLQFYSRMFNAVEGNSTFYGGLNPDQACRWVESSAEGFQFFLKFPRLISHEQELLGVKRETELFIESLRILDAGNRLGSTFLQLGPNFSPGKFSRLEDFLTALPADLPWAVELRNHDWYDRGSNERTSNQLLRSLNIDKVLFDSRALFSSEPEDAAERKSQSRKPRTPVRQTVTGKRPMLRLIGRNRVQQASFHTKQWAKIVAEWLSKGLRPTIFTHTPDDTFAPDFARMFYDELSSMVESPLPALPTLPQKPRQLELL